MGSSLTRSNEGGPYSAGFIIEALIRRPFNASWRLLGALGDLSGEIPGFPLVSSECSLISPGAFW